jgi:hypothetical protein
MDLPRTWFLDFDGTLVLHDSHKSDVDSVLPGTYDFFRQFVKKNDRVVITTARDCEHRERISLFMIAHGFRCDEILCGLPTGPRIVINDRKPDGSTTAHSVNLERDSGIRPEDLDYAFYQD